MTTSSFRMLVVAAATGMTTLAGVATGVAASATSPGTTGQPGETCLSDTAPLEPGNAASAPGSAFNEVDGIAGAVYAGSQPQNSKNVHSVSQYDVACFQVSPH
jgi:hypothetical protein